LHGVIDRFVGRFVSYLVGSFVDRLIGRLVRELVGKNDVGAGVGRLFVLRPPVGRQIGRLVGDGIIGDLVPVDGARHFVRAGGNEEYHQQRQQNFRLSHDLLPALLVAFSWYTGRAANQGFFRRHRAVAAALLSRERPFFAKFPYRLPREFAALLGHDVVEDAVAHLLGRVILKPIQTMVKTTASAMPIFAFMLSSLSPSLSRRR